MSLHRSEGFGLAIAEGNTGPLLRHHQLIGERGLTREAGFLVPYRLIPAADPQGTYYFPDGL